MEFVLNSLSGENRSRHPVQFRTLQESCRVEEISQGGEVKLQSSNEGKIIDICGRCICSLKVRALGRSRCKC